MSDFKSPIVRQPGVKFLENLIISSHKTGFSTPEKPTKQKNPQCNVSFNLDLIKRPVPHVAEIPQSLVVLLHAHRVLRRATEVSSTQKGKSINGT